MRNSRRNRGGQAESSKLHKNPFLIWTRAVYETLSHITTLPRDFLALSLPHPSRRAAFFTSFENIQRDRFAYPRLAAPVGVKIVSPLQRRIQPLGIGGVSDEFLHVDDGVERPRGPDPVVDPHAQDRKSTRLKSSHYSASRMTSSSWKINKK